MLLAAGFGTRLRPYSLVRPKPLFPVLNRPLLLLLLDMLDTSECSLAVVNGHHLWGQIKEAVAGLPSVRFQYEPDILGTGGSLRQALPEFSDDPVLVMNGDIYHTVNLSQLYQYHRESGNKVTLALHNYPRFNTVRVQDGLVRAFRPEKDSSAAEYLAFTGIHVVDPEIIERIPANRFHHIIDLYESMAVLGERIGFSRIDGSFWQDIGTPEDYLSLHRELLSGCLKKTSEALNLMGQWLVSDTAYLGSSVVLDGWGCIGRAGIGSNVSMKNCVVWDDVDIPAGTHLENAVVAESPRKQYMYIKSGGLP